MVTAVRSMKWVGDFSHLESTTGNGGPDGNRTDGLPRKAAHCRGNSTGRLVVGNCVPDCALTGVYPRRRVSPFARHLRYDADFNLNLTTGRAGGGVRPMLPKQFAEASSLAVVETQRLPPSLDSELDSLLAETRSDLSAHDEATHTPPRRPTEIEPRPKSRRSRRSS